MTSGSMPQDVKDLIHDENTDEQEKLAAIKEWRASRYSVSSSEDAEAAQAIYNSNKIEGNTFISATVFLPSGNGVINCRHPDTLDHCQIRF